MRSLKLISSFILLSLLFSCNKTDESNPEDNNTNPTPTTVGTAEIGYDGGVFEYEDFKMEVPEGAFNGYFELSLEKYPSQSLMGSNEASVFYQIKGLPIEVLENISFSLASSSTDEIYAVIGQKTKALSAANTALNFQFFDVNKEEEQFVLNLESTDIPDYSTDDTMSIVIGLVKGYSKVESKGHFKIYTPAVYIDDAYNLEQYLEEAYAKFESSAFNFAYQRRSKWPVSVSIKKLESGTYGYFIPSKWGNNYGSMVFNQDYISDSKELRLTAGHEFFHLVQALYDPRYGFTKAILPSSYYWVEEASSVYAEAYFTDESNYTSSIRNGHQMAPFKGFLAGAKENAQYHGYGMSAFVKYMSEQYGSDKLVKVYNYEAGNQSNIIDAFNTAYGISISDIYDDFINDYILSNIYNDFGASNLLGETNGSFSVNAAGDSLKVFEDTYPALSAKVYKIDINYNGFNDQNSLLMHSDGMKKLVYKIQGGDISFLGSSSGDYTLTNLADIQQENALILVVMVSHYYAETSGMLELKVTTSKPVAFDGVGYKVVHLPLIENVVLPDGSTITQEVNFDYTYDYGLIGEYIDGSYNAGVFEANWDYAESWNYQSKGNLEIIIDEQTQKIVNGSIHARLESISDPDNGYKTMDISFANIQANYWGDQRAEFVVTSADFCNAGIITSFDEVSYFNNFYRTLISYSCDDYSQFVIKLRIAP